MLVAPIITARSEAGARAKQSNPAKSGYGLQYSHFIYKETTLLTASDYFIKFNNSDTRRTLMTSFQGISLLVSLNRLLTLF